MTSISKGEIKPVINADIGFTQKEKTNLKRIVAKNVNRDLNPTTESVTNGFKEYLEKDFTNDIETIIGERFEELNTNVEKDYEKVRNSLTESTNAINGEIGDAKESFNYAKQYLGEVEDYAKDVNKEIDKTNNALERKLAIYTTLRLLPVAIILIAVASFGVIAVKIANMIIAMNIFAAQVTVTLVLLFALAIAFALIWEKFR